MSSKDHPPLAAPRAEFVAQWGAIGSAWGINRTMAMIHALLLTSPEAMSTDEIMETLRISRGNANTNLRDLVGWGLIRSVVRMGERKEYFEAEKDVWKIFCTVARERKRRELVPALEVVERCAEQTAGAKGEGDQQFHTTMAELAEFLRMAERLIDTVAASERSRALKLASSVLGRK